MQCSTKMRFWLKIYVRASTAHVHLCTDSKLIFCSSCTHTHTHTQINHGTAQRTHLCVKQANYANLVPVFYQNQTVILYVHTRNNINNAAFGFHTWFDIPIDVSVALYGCVCVCVSTYVCNTMLYLFLLDLCLCVFARRGVCSFRIQK